MSQELQFHATGCFEVIVMETEKLVVGVKCKNDGTSAKHQKDEVHILLFGCTHRIEEICFANPGLRWSLKSSTFRGHGARRFRVRYRDVLGSRVPAT